MFEKIKRLWGTKHLLTICLKVDAYKKDKTKNNCEIFCSKKISDVETKKKINELVDYIRENHELL